MIVNYSKQTSTRWYTAPECEVMEVSVHQPLMQSLDIPDITEEELDWQ